MFTALSHMCSGLVMADINRLIRLTTVGTGYVNDVTMVVSVEKDELQNISMIKKILKIVTTKWEKLLFLTGGKLELSKCFWVPINCGWRKGCPVLKQTPRRSSELHIVDSETGEPVKIPLLTTTAAPKRLGIRYSVDNSWREEYTFWKNS